MFTTLVTTAHVFVCLVLIGIVLLQQGKGADMGATFGGGGNTVFGATGADNLLTKVTTTTAMLFMVLSVILSTQGRPAARNTDTQLFNSSPATAPVEEVPATNTKAVTETAPAAEEQASEETANAPASGEAAKAPAAAAEEAAKLEEGAKEAVNAASATTAAVIEEAASKVEEAAVAVEKAAKEAPAAAAAVAEAAKKDAAAVEDKAAAQAAE